MDEEEKNQKIREKALNALGFSSKKRDDRSRRGVPFNVELNEEREKENKKQKT